MRRFGFVVTLCATRLMFGGGLFEIFPVSGKANDVSYEFNITAADVAHTPIWSAGSDNPPLSARSADNVARRQLQELVPTARDWVRRQVRLVAFGDNLHWIYVVEFEPPPLENVAEFGRDYMRIPVLFDGRVITPKLTPIPK